MAIPLPPGCPPPPLIQDHGSGIFPLDVWDQLPIAPGAQLPPCIAQPMAPAIPTPTPAVTIDYGGPKPKRINVRDKGQRGERQVVVIIQDIVTRTRARYSLEPLLIQRNQLQSWQGGADLHGLDRFAIEVKWQENESVDAWWRQAVRQAGTAKMPILFYKSNHKPWRVRMRAWVNTTGDRDQIEMDFTTDLKDFELWFAEAYDELCVDELQVLK